MSLGKFLGGTVIATPAVGGGGYVIYKEVTKETTEVDTSTEGTTNNVVSEEAQPQPPVERSEEDTSGKGASQEGAGSGGPTASGTDAEQQGGRSAPPAPNVVASAGQDGPSGVASPGSSGISNSHGA